MTVVPGPVGRLYDPLNPTLHHAARRSRTVPEAALALWQHRQAGTGNVHTLTAWETSTAADGRPLHEARLTCLNPVLVLEKFVMQNGLTASPVVQRLPVLDFSVPGRVQCLWLLDGEWVSLWAPDTQDGPAPHPVGVTPVEADRLLTAALAATPSARLRFTRRPKTRKEPAA